MKLQIKSKQNYGTHCEEYTETFLCEETQEEGKRVITFDSGTITLEENRIRYQRGENEILIVAGETTECDYETPQGTFVLDIRCLVLHVDLQATTCLATAKYEIQIVGIEPYENEIEIWVEE